MRVRNLIGGALVLGLVLLPSVVGCQQQPAGNNPATNVDLEKILKRLDEMVTRHDLDEAAKGWASKKDVEAVQARVAPVETDCTPMSMPPMSTAQCWAKWQRKSTRTFLASWRN